MFGWLTGGEEKPVVKEVVRGKETPSEGSASTPMVVVKCLWEEDVEKPREGAWCVSELNCKVRSRPQQGQNKPLTHWHVTDTRDDGLPTLTCPDNLRYTIRPVAASKNKKFTELPLPELFTPTWVAIGDTEVHWLQKVSAGRIASLTQPILMCNGSSIGKRQFLYNEIVEEEEGKSLCDTDYTGAAYKQAAINLKVEVMWKTDESVATLKPNPSLPKWVRDVSLSHSCHCWVLNSGWVTTTSAATWLVLHEHMLHYAVAPNASEYHEIPLKGVVIETSSMVIGPNRMMQYPLKVKNKGGGVFEVNFYTEGERDLWCAMLDVTAAQIDGKKVSAVKLSIYERILTQGLLPKPVPCIDPVMTPDDLQSCVASGYVIVQSQTGGWLAESWKRRWVTVHDTFFTYRDGKTIEGTGGFEVCRFHYTRIMKAPQKDHPWVFVLYNPFSDPVHVWCDGKPAFAKWLAIFDRGVHRANHNTSYLEVGSVPQVGRPFVAKHGVVVPNGYPALPFVSESCFRQLVTVDGVVGSEDGEVVVAEDGGLSWKEPVPGYLTDLTPKHYVLRGKKWNDPTPTPTTVTDCLLPQSVVSTHAPVPMLIPSSCLLITLPPNTRTVPSSQERHTSLLTLTGTLRITVFPGSCYTQITPAYPKVRTSSYDLPLPEDWGSSNCPVAYKGARTVEVPAGSYLYIPVDHFYAVHSPVESVVLQCSYKREE